jgi:hypothetical protein
VCIAKSRNTKNIENAQQSFAKKKKKKKSVQIWGKRAVMSSLEELNILDAVQTMDGQPVTLVVRRHTTERNLVALCVRHKETVK